MLRSLRCVTETGPELDYVGRHLLLGKVISKRKRRLVTCKRVLLKRNDKKKTANGKRRLFMVEVPIKFHASPHRGEDMLVSTSRFFFFNIFICFCL